MLLRKATVILAALLLWPILAVAQVTDRDDGSLVGNQSTAKVINLSYLWNGSTWARVPGDSTNGVKVQCVIGCTPAASDSDDATIAGGQTGLSLSLGLTQVWDGANWKRFTVGTAGTASTQVVTVQGIASGTNLNVTCSNCSGSGVSVNEDVASANADPGTPAYAVRKATPANTSTTDGDYEALQILNGQLYTQGAKTNNNAAPGANNLGVLPALANAAAPAWTEGLQVNASVDLHGSLRATLLDAAGATVPNSTAGAGAVDANTTRTVTATDSPDVTSLALIDDVVGTIGAAPPAKADYVGGVTSGATGGLLAGLPICDSQGWLDMTTATTSEIAPLVASRTIHVCSIVALAGGTTTMTLKRGTGADCVTGTTSVSPGFELTAQTGFTLGTGLGEVLGAAGAGSHGGAMTASNALCVTSSANVNLHVLVRYAVY